MPLTLGTAVFAIAGLIALWSVANDIGSGKAATTKPAWTIDRDENPGGFWFTVLCKAAFVGFAIAVLLHALGLIGDPVVWIQQTFPFFARRSS